MSSHPDLVAALAVVAAVLAAGSLVVAAAALGSLRRMRRVAGMRAGRPADDLLRVVDRHSETLHRLDAQLAGVRDDLADAVRHVAVVRYDAFGDMGGRLSFSLALLDDGGDGLVLTSINARSETRTYAKGIKGAASDQQLSPEEEQAVSFARRSAGRPPRQRAAAARG